MIIEAFSLDAELTEAEYLQRELGIFWREVNESKLIHQVHENYQSGNRTLIIVSDASKHLPVITRLPSNSVVIILLSDEGTNRDALALVECQAVCFCFRNYSVDLLPTADFLRIAVLLFKDAFSFGALGTKGAFISHWARSLFLGYKRRSQIRKWSTIRDKFSYIPLGYTKKFALSLLSYLEKDSFEGSLYELGKVKPKLEISNSVSFSGSLGSWQRRVGLQRLAREKSSRLKISNGRWLGHQENVDSTDFEYCKELLNNAYVFCPPGYLSNESYRVEEALICGSYPLFLNAAITQGCREGTIALREISYW
ncbi:MAG: hypothetical protein RSC50_00220, partial [Aurantimicrobium sp.]